jgi:sigma-B regulation protein RsbU (phosphoserine phosphatase)
MNRIEDPPETSGTTLPAPVRMVCSQIRGGNGAVHAPVDLPGIKGVLYSRPCVGGRGGDVYYLSICGSGLLSRICVADVVGHGEAVSQISSDMHGLLRRLMNWPDQRRVLRDLNLLLERRGLDAMATLAAITYYPPTRKLSFSYAGHPPGWLFRRSVDRWERLRLDADGRSTDAFVNGALAVTTEAAFTRSSVRVDYGDRLFIVTDGVLEAINADGELFGTDLVEQILHEQRDGTPDQIAHVLLEALDAHCEGFATQDDLTFLCVEFTHDLKGPALWHVLRNRVLRPLGLKGRRGGGQE